MKFISALKELYMKKLGLMSVLTIAAIIIITVASLWLGTWLATERMVSIANQFKPDVSWILEKDDLVPIGTPCLGNCPSVSRAWSLQIPINNKPEFKKIANLDGLPMDIESECFYIESTDPPFERIGTDSCTAVLEKDGFYIMLSYSEHEGSAKILLRVHPK